MCRVCASIISLRPFNYPQALAGPCMRVITAATNRREGRRRAPATRRHHHFIILSRARRKALRPRQKQRNAARKALSWRDGLSSAPAGELVSERLLFAGGEACGMPRSAASRRGSSSSLGGMKYHHPRRRKYTPPPGYARSSALCLGGGASGMCARENYQWPVLVACEALSVSCTGVG